MNGASSSRMLGESVSAGGRRMTHLLAQGKAGRLRFCGQRADPAAPSPPAPSTSPMPSIRPEKNLLPVPLSLVLGSSRSASGILFLQLLSSLCNCDLTAWSASPGLYRSNAKSAFTGTFFSPLWQWLLHVDFVAGCRVTVPSQTV